MNLNQLKKLIKLNGIQLKSLEILEKVNKGDIDQLEGLSKITDMLTYEETKFSKISKLIIKWKMKLKEKIFKNIFLVKIYCFFDKSIFHLEDYIDEVTKFSKARARFSDTWSALILLIRYKDYVTANRVITMIILEDYKNEILEMQLNKELENN